MANQFQTTATGLAELKNYYQGPIVDQFNEDVPIYRGSEKVKQGWSGQQVIRPLRVRKNQGIGAVADNGALPAIGFQTTVQAIVAAKYNYLRFGVTGPMIKSSQSDVGSFVRSAAYELEMGYKDLMNDCNRQFGYDGTGKLALMSAAATGTNTITIAGRESGTYASNEAALKFIDVGTIFDITDGTNIKASGVTVNSITTGTPTSTTATIVLSQAVTCLSTDYLIRSGSLGNEIQGLVYALDGGTTTVYNVPRSSYLSYQGNVNDLAGAALSLNQMQFPYNEGIRRGGAKYSAIYSDFDSLRYYQKLLTADKRYMNTTKGDGGFANKDRFYMDFNGLPWVPDKDCPQRIFFLPEDVLKSYVLAEMEFADETGSMYIAQTSTDAFEVRVRFFTNLFNEQPSACGVVRNYISP
jgi:hypothetical protein